MGHFDGAGGGVRSDEAAEVMREMGVEVEVKSALMMRACGSFRGAGAEVEMESDLMTKACGVVRGVDV